MNKKLDVVNNFVKTYRSLALIPTITEAKIVFWDSNSNFLKILSKWSQRNVEKGEIIKFKKHHILNVSTGDVLFESMPIDVSQETLSKSSRLGKLNCIIREVKEDNRKKQYIEIWNKENLCKNFDVNAFDLHGDIYCDVEFGSLEWSPNDDKIIYIAEKKNKNQPFYKQKSKEENQQEKFLKEDSIVGDEYLYKPDWGEQLVGKHHPVIGLCDLTEETLKILDGIPPNFSPGQVFWSKDGKSIFGVALETEPRRLGLIYCTNRIGYIFQLTLEGVFKILSNNDKSVSSPRLSPDGATLYWLQRPAKGAHGGCYELIRYDLNSNKSEVMIEIIRKGNKEFSGLYMHNLPIRCFSEDGKKMFFSTLNRNKIMSYSFNLESKNIEILETGEGSFTILDVHKDIILVSSGTLQQPSALKLSKSIEKILWIPVTKSNIVCENSVLKELEFNSDDSTHTFTYYNAFYYGPSINNSEEKKIPLIVYPHGGPHSATINEFWLEPTFFVSLGYGVLMVNYRGSTGVGQDGIDFLLGKVGDTDVKDNHNAVLSVLKNFPYIDSKNIFLFGKSHGGFLVGHLSAQYPDFYRAVVNLNGVTDIFAMYTMSDIPDWSTAESGLIFDESKPLSLSDANAMLLKSPVQLGDKIKAPTLFLIGKNDLRVPYYQGIKLYNSLKSRKVKVRLNLYEDNHSLASVPVHIDCTVHSALWFFENKS